MKLRLIESLEGFVLRTHLSMGIRYRVAQDEGWMEDQKKNRAEEESWL